MARLVGRLDDCQCRDVLDWVTDKLAKASCAVIVMSISIAGLSACGNKEDPKERAGKEIDESVESTGKQIEKAG